MRRVFNARWFGLAGLSREAVEYLRLNDEDTTTVITDLATHIAAADPHPQYQTVAESEATALAAANKAAITHTFLLMGA